MSSDHIQAKDEPGPREVLYALRQAIADDSRLKTTPAKEVVRQFIARGYLPEEPSPALVADVLEILRAGGLGLRSPTLIPCSLELFWDDDVGNLHSNIDLSLSVEWVGAPDIWEERTLPEKLTHTKTPPCTDLISDPMGVLRNKERWPIHLCDAEFLRPSTELWVQAQEFTADTLNVYRWASMHPLPIGWRALTENREANDLSEWSEVLNVLPFAGYEKAMWALRVEVQGGVLDLFGLEDYPTEFHKAHGIPVAGDLAFMLRGRDTSLTDLVHEAKRWWSPFRGRALQGRPRGSGTWQDAGEFREAARNVVRTLREHGYKPTQENVAENLGCNDRVLRYWIDRYGVTWNDLLKAP